MEQKKSASLIENRFDNSSQIFDTLLKTEDEERRVMGNDQNLIDSSESFSDYYERSEDFSM